LDNPIIEHAYTTMKPGGGEVYVAMFPTLRDIMLSLPGAISARLLRYQKSPERFVCRWEWESKAAKDVFAADPRLKPWADEFWKWVESETIDYFDHVG
jgi:heme-degrading monooxygenase HmoA